MHTIGKFFCIVFPQALVSGEINIDYRLVDFSRFIRLHLLSGRRLKMQVFDLFLTRLPKGLTFLTLNLMEIN